MTAFTAKCVNRAEYPTKHVLICEDNLEMQAKFAEWAAKLFPPEGKVQCSFVCGGAIAAAILSSFSVEVILLDHDMPLGDGGELLKWITATYGESRQRPFIVGASGIPSNNAHLLALGADTAATKAQVIGGAFNDEIMARLAL